MLRDTPARLSVVEATTEETTGPVVVPGCTVELRKETSESIKLEFNYAHVKASLMQSIGGSVRLQS